jgi:DNA-binding transcriptional ArsR family regulator
VRALPDQPSFIGTAYFIPTIDIELDTLQTDEMQDIEIIKALGNERRLTILQWLKNPRAHFAPQVDGDLVDDGVCAVLIAEKLGITQATLSEHMRVLVQAGLVSSKRIKQWTFYRRDEDRIRDAKTRLIDNL